MAEVEYYQGALTGEQIDALPTKLNNSQLVENWYFVGGGDQTGAGKFPLNIRGVTTKTGKNNYFIDRWFIDNNNTTVTLQSGFLRITGNNGNGTLAQRVNAPVAELYNKTCTISALYRGTGTINAAINTVTKHFKSISSDSWTLGTVSFVFSEEADRDVPSFWLTATDNGGGTYQLDVMAVKFEIGSTQTLAQLDANGDWQLNTLPKYEEQLILCRTSTADTSNPGDDKAGGNVAIIGDNIIIEDSPSIALNPWPVTAYYYAVLTAPTGYEVISANITQFTESSGELPQIAFGSNAGFVYLIKPTSKTYASNATCKVRAIYKRK